MKQYTDFTIYKDTPLLYKDKIPCYSLKRKKHYRCFQVLNGDIPIINLSKGGKSTPVVNTRGLAYAARNRLKYKKNKKQILESISRKEAVC